MTVTNLPGISSLEFSTCIAGTFTGRGLPPAETGHDVAASRTGLRVTASRQHQQLLSSPARSSRVADHRLVEGARAELLFQHDLTMT
jgi:hypothetical protein